MGYGDVFFGPALDSGSSNKSEPGRPERIAIAKAICERCPVEDDCREWAIETKLSHGIAGGMTERARRAEYKRRRDDG